MRLLRSSLLIAATAAAVGAAPAAAQDSHPGLPTVYGGGVLVGTGERADPGTTAIGIHRAGDELILRITVVVPCKPYSDGARRGSDIRVRARLKADGTFVLNDRPAKTTGELGRVRVTAAGTLTPARADGTARITASIGCGGQVRTWSARPVDPKAPPAGAPAPVDGLLYGVTAEDQSLGPHGFVAQVSDGGTKVRMFTSWTLTCHGRDRKGLYRAETAIQGQFPPLPIAAGRVAWHKTFHADRSARRRGVRGTEITRLDATFAGPVFAGTLTRRKTWRQGRERERCGAGPLRFVAAP